MTLVATVVERERVTMHCGSGPMKATRYPHVMQVFWECRIGGDRDRYHNSRSTATKGPFTLSPSHSWKVLSIPCNFIELFMSSSKYALHKRQHKTHRLKNDHSHPLSKSSYTHLKTCAPSPDAPFQLLMVTMIVQI